MCTKIPNLNHFNSILKEAIFRVLHSGSLKLGWQRRRVMVDRRGRDDDVVVVAALRHEAGRQCGDAIAA